MVAAHRRGGICLSLFKEDLTYFISSYFCSMKRTLSRYNKCLDFSEAAVAEYKTEVLIDT